MSVSAPLSPKDRREVKTTALFLNAPSKAFNAIVSASDVCAFRHRAVVYQPGQPADFIYMTLRGKFCILRGPCDGKHAVLSVPRTGSAFGLEDAFTTGRHSATAQAVGSSRALRIPAARFRSEAVKHARMADDLIATISQSLSRASDQLELIQLKPTVQRLGDFLLRQAATDHANVEFTLPYEKSLIAAYLGMEPESLSRALKDLQAVGVTNRGRQVQIRDVGDLRAFCAPAPQDTAPTGTIRPKHNVRAVR